MGPHPFDELISRAQAAMPGWIDAAAVAGSYARRDHDRHSDLDMFFLLASDSQVDIPEACRYLSAWAGPALLSRGPVFVPHFGHSMTLVLDGLAVCQFNLNTRNTLELNPMRSTSQILFDRSGHLTEVVGKAKALKVDEVAVHREQQDYFWIRALFAWRAFQRGELWRAIDYLGDMRQAMQQIMRLQRGVYDSVKSPYRPAKRFEELLGNDSGRSLRSTQPAYAREQIMAGLLESVEWFFEATQGAMESDSDAARRNCAAQIRNLIGSRR